MFDRTIRAAVAFAAAVALAATVFLACSGASSQPTPQPAATEAPLPTTAPAAPPATETPVPDTPTPVAQAQPTEPSMEELTEGLCLPAAPLGVSIGDSWTVTGPVSVSGNFPGEVPPGASNVTFRFTVSGIEGTDFGTPASPLFVENSIVNIHIEHTISDQEGRPIQSNQGDSAGPAINIGNLSPVVTPDWECHTSSWLEGWAEITAEASAPAPEATVEERTLDSGVTAMLFSVKQSVNLQEQGFSQTTQRSFGYEKATGKLVLIETHATGNWNGEPFTLDIAQQVVTE